jgi:N-acetylglutamate synthase/N-acetylornithine aminotransferase
VHVASAGGAVALAEDGQRRLTDAMAAAEVEMRLDLAPAGEEAEIFFCDLGPEYVRFNSEYTT